MKARVFAILVALLAMSAARADAPVTTDSIYQLEAHLTNQSGIVHGLDVYRGRPVLVTMFYSGCQMTCPLLIDTLRALEHAVPPRQRTNLRILMISIDPAHDTPAALQGVVTQRRLDTTAWTLARAEERDVRKIAALLNVQYRALPSGGYNHSSIVTLLDSAGEIVVQSNVLGRADERLVTAIGNTADRARIATP